MEYLPKEMVQVHARWAPIDSRVAEIQENVRGDCGNRLPGESYNRANERLVEEFIAWLRQEFPGRTFEVERSRDRAAPEKFGRQGEQARAPRESPCVVIERQRLSPWALRTTRWNYTFIVPGEKPEVFLLVAHYDTWRGPGADDNTTGEEILKQYLLADLRSEKPPKMTHAYFLAGSEECGLVGILSQILLAGGLTAAVQAFQQNNWLYFALALALAPLASYRFGVSGSREYVRALSSEELDLIRAVVSVDSVGEGRIFIPRSTLGADFIHALIPFGDYAAFTELLEEGAHLHGIKYNNYLAGGTTDHLSFLEVNNGLRARALAALRRGWAWLAGKDCAPRRSIPASALVAMLPGKASPLVFGGKIHTPQDVPSRVYDQPLRETLLVLDYLFYILEGGPRIREPRALDEFHYARLYEISGASGVEPEYWLALKDALEPNRRNLNAIYRAEAEVDAEGKKAVVLPREIIGWDVNPRLRLDVRKLCNTRRSKYERVRVDRITLLDNQSQHTFARHLSTPDRLVRVYHRSVAWLARQMGRYSFLTFFGVAYLVSALMTRALTFVFLWSSAFLEWFFKYEVVTLPSVLILQLCILVNLMVRRIPTWIDNEYRHENRDDNMGSLRRVMAIA